MLYARNLIKLIAFFLCPFGVLFTLVQVNFQRAAESFHFDQKYDRRSIRCPGLLREGHFKNDSSPDNSTSLIWFSDSCNLTIYSEKDSKRCFRKLSHAGCPYHLAFVGDSRLRQLRDGLVYQLTGVEKDWLSNRSVKGDSDDICKHENQFMTLWTVPVKIDFFWAPTLDRTHDIVRNFFLLSQKNSASSSKVATQPPDVIVMGNGLWTIQTCIQNKITESECFASYKRAFSALLPLLRQIGPKTTLLWTPQTLVERKKPHGPTDNIEWYSRENIDILNDAVRYSLSNLTTSPNSPSDLNSSTDRATKIEYWKSFADTFQLDDSLDGMHLGPKTRFTDIQILLNFLCAF